MKSITQALVDRELQQAMFNGFSEPFPTNASELAVDMLCYDPEVEGCDPDQVKALVEDFLRRNPTYLEDIAK